jgi:RNA polymerase sigma-70 factor (ECF subfamily)
MSDAESDDPSGRDPGTFLTTRWSLIVTAGIGKSDDAARALNELCQTYWYPLYCYVRRRGYSPADAEDLVQGFFAQMLEKDLFGQAEPGKGRLRGFLLSSLRFYLADERKAASAEKRGGQVSFVPIDTTDAEARYAGEPADNTSPDRVFERRWAALVLQRAVAVLGEVWRKEGKGDLYAALSPHLFDQLDGPAAASIAQQFGMTENNVKVSLHRLRERYRGELRREIAETVASASDVDEEIASLRAALM